MSLHAMTHHTIRSMSGMKMWTPAEPQCARNCTGYRHPELNFTTGHLHRQMPSNSGPHPPYLKKALMA